jgi:PHP family Zn ribbon phosphoesterase
MREYRADLHIHTVLSPCGDLSMSPANIVSEAVRKGIDIIGITDHNTTRHCRLISKLAAEKGIFTMTGAEVTTKEEVHCLAFFENTDTLEKFQGFIGNQLPDIKNDPDIFGDQVEVDEDENIIYTETRLLTNATGISLEELEEYIHSNNGLFIPAHINRMKNSIYSQLGFLPGNLKADALEVSWKNNPGGFISSHRELDAYTIITNSDSHYTENIGCAYTIFRMEEPSFGEVRMALAGKNERSTRIL